MSSSAGGEYCASFPPLRSTAMRSPILIASSMSCVTNTIVFRISCCSRRNSFCSRSRLIGSIAPKGSSMSISGGSTASARATPRAGAGHPRAGRVAVAGLAGSSDTSSSSSSIRARAVLVPPQQARDGGHVLADRQVGEQPDLLDRVADLASEVCGGTVADAHAVESDVPAGDVDHPVDHPHGRGLPASRGRPGRRSRPPAPPGSGRRPPARPGGR